jgi:hypothetical protein
MLGHGICRPCRDCAVLLGAQLKATLQHWAKEELQCRLQRPFALSPFHSIREPSVSRTESANPKPFSTGNYR